MEKQSLYHKLFDREKTALAETLEFCRQNGIKMAASGGEHITPSGSISGLETLDKEYPWRLTYIQANGDVSPCSFAPFTGKDGGPLPGNVFEKPLEEIWQGPIYQEFRQAFCQKPCPSVAKVVGPGGAFKTGVV